MARFAFILSLALAAILMRAVVSPFPAQGQTFFAESEALKPGSGLLLTLSDLTDDSSTDSSVGVNISEVDSSLRRLEARFRHGFFGIGGTGESREFQERTESFLQRDDREQSAGFLALSFQGLFFDEDALFLVVSAGSRREEFTFQSYRRNLESDLKSQTGIMLKVGVFVAGYSRGHEQVRLEIDDPGFATVREIYDFRFQARIAGLILGDTDDIGLSLVWQRKETPSVTGTAVDLEAGFEELRRALLGLGVFSLEFTETRFHESFSGQSLRNSRERDISLGIRVGDNVGLAISQKKIVDTQGFTLSGVPSLDRTERTENLFRFGLRF